MLIMIMLHSQSLSRIYIHDYSSVAFASNLCVIVLFIRCIDVDSLIKLKTIVLSQIFQFTTPLFSYL